MQRGKIITASLLTAMCWLVGGLTSAQAGAFGGQYVCVKLQELDYYGTYYDRTAFWCSKYTVGAVATAGRSATCAEAEAGTFRTYGRGCAYPDDKVCKDEWSEGVRMCG